MDNNIIHQIKYNKNIKNDNGISILRVKYSKTKQSSSSISLLESMSKYVYMYNLMTHSLIDNAHFETKTRIKYIYITSIFL